MAIGKIIKGSHFDAAVRYLLGEGNEPREKTSLPGTEDEWIAPGYDEGRRARILLSNMSGANRKEWAKEFGHVENLRSGRKIKDPMRHITFSLRDSESLTTAKWQEVAENILERTGYRDSPYLIVQHRDRSHDHIHIVTSRITYAGKTVSDSFEKDKLRTVAREIEEKYDLTRTPQRAEKKTKSKGEAELSKRTGEPTLREEIQNQIDEIRKQQRSASEFAKELRQQGIFFKPNIQKSGRVVGVSFAKADKDGKVWAFKGSSLGETYKWSEIAKQINYHPERDADVFIEAKREAEQAERSEIISPVSPPANKQAAEVASTEKTQSKNIAVENQKPILRPLTAHLERETAIADLINQHNEEARGWKGAELTYPQQKRLAKFYRESGEKPPLEKQITRLEKIQERLNEPLPRPRTLLEASMLTLDNLTDSERKEILQQQIQNISDLMEREASPKSRLENLNQSTTEVARGSASKQGKSEKNDFRQISEAQERRFITPSLDKEQIRHGFEQMQIADAMCRHIRESLTEQGIMLESRAERIISLTIDSWAKQQATAEETEKVQEIADRTGASSYVENRLQAIAYVFAHSSEQERDKFSVDLAGLASEKVEEIKTIQAQERTQVKINNLEKPHENNDRDFPR